MISIDTETTGIDFAHGALPYLVTICDHDQQQRFWEWDVDPLTRKPLLIYKDIKEIYKAVTEEKDKLIFQNATFDTKAISIIIPKLKWDWEKIEDTFYSAHLLASNHQKDLTSLCLEYLGINIEPYELTVEKAVLEAKKIITKKYPDWQLAKEGRADMPSAKKKVWKYDMWLPRAVAKAEGYVEDHPWWTVTSIYANVDSSATIYLWQKHKQILEDRKLGKIYRERLKLLPLVSSMQQKGITLSRTRLDELYDKFSKGAGICEAECLRLSDNEIEKLPLNGISNDLKKVLTEKFELVSTKTTKKGNDSYDKYVMDEWLIKLDPKRRAYKFVDNLKRYRQQKTAVSFLKSYRKFGIPLDDVFNVIFCSLNPCGTDTTRWSSSNPNQMQISKLSEYNLRYCFGPKEGREWWALDYDNLELRLPAYESGEQMMIQIFEEPDKAPYFGSYHLLIFDLLHPDKWNRNDPKGLLKAKEEYKSTWYGWTKNFNFATQYGAQEGSGTADQAAHVPGAQRMIGKKLKKVEALTNKYIAMANDLGYVETIPDKEIDPERGYPLLCTRSAWGRVKPTLPFSYHIQGTACWVMMRAMIKVKVYLDAIENFDGHIIMNVHDELVLDFPKKENRGNLPIVNKVRTIMESIGKCVGVPLTCGVDFHPETWAKGLAL